MSLMMSQCNRLQVKKVLILCLEIDIKIIKRRVVYLSLYCFHPWCSGGREVGKSLSGLYLRNCKVKEVDTW